jgi:hypothetical protein
MLASSGCLPRQPSQVLVLGDLLVEEEFDTPTAWEAYRDPAIKVELGVRDGSYHVRAEDGGFMWGLNSRIDTDVVIEVATEQLSDYADNAYGVMCRADQEGDGYYFFISGDGHYTLRRGAGDEVLALIEWSPTPAIHQGRARNRIRAVCAQDYLALYVNDIFVDETRDSLYVRGVTGLVAAVPPGGVVEVTFDKLLIFSVELAPQR